MSEEQVSPGTYLQQILNEKKGEVSATNNPAGFVAYLPWAAREVLIKYPALTSEQRTILRAALNDEVRLTCLRTGQNQELYTTALQEVARILA